MGEAAAIEAGLTGLIRQNLPEARDVAVSALRRIVGGNSSEIWEFNAHWRDEDGVRDRALILRRAVENEFGSAGRAAEFRLLQALAATSVPAPRAWWFDAAGDHLGRAAMVMDRAGGRADRQAIKEENGLGLDAANRVALAGSIADHLGAIHALDVTTLDLDQAMRSTGNPAQRQLEFYDAEIRRQEVTPMVELRLASLWLHDQLPLTPARTVLVHGDYRPANLLVEGKQIAAILDWEFAHEGDPAEDLGWYLAPYYAGEHLIPGAWSADDFLARYEAAAGAPVDRAALRFWSVFALYKLASMTVGALRGFADGDLSRLTPSARFILDPLLDAIGDAA